MLRDYFHHAARFPLAAKLFLAGEFLAGVGQGTIWVLRNLYLDRLGYDERFIGESLSMFSLGLVAAIPLCFIMDRGRLKGYLSAGALALGAGIVATAVWPSRVPILMSGFITGAGTALLTIGSVPFYMRLSTPAERPFLFGIGTALAPASGLAGTALVWILAKAWGDDAEGMRRILILSGVIAAAGAAVFAWIREPRVAAGVPERLEADRRVAFRLLSPLAIIGLGAGLTIPFINLYFQGRFGYKPGPVSAIYTGAQFLTCFAFLASPLLARRIGGVRAVVVFQLLSIPFFLVMAFTGRAPLAVGAFLLRHALMNMAGPVNAQFAMEVVPANKRVLTNGLREMTWNGMFAAGTAAGGWVIHAKWLGDGYTVTMLATIALYLAGSVLFYAFWRSSRVLKAKESSVPEPIQA